MKYFFFTSLLFLEVSLFAQENKTLWTAAWSHDDKYIAIGGDQGQLMLFDGQTFQLIKTYPIKETISRVKWHPSKNVLAVITQSDSFKAQILDVEKETWTALEGLQTSLRALDWNHTGELLAVSEFEGEISVYTAKGKRLSRFLADPKSVTGIDWHPTKNILAAVGSRIGIYNHLGDSINAFQPRDEGVFLLCVEWHKSGKFFAVGDYGFSENAEDKLIQYWNVRGKKLAEAKGSDAEFRNIRWNPKGNQLASASEALRIWNKKGKLLQKSASTDDYLWGIDWNSDGSKIITTSDQGVISLWDNNANFIQNISY